MANYERGIYEPPSDDIRIFDGGEDDIDEEGSRLPLLIVIALLVLAAFAGVVWLAYTQGVQRGRSDAPRIIAATPGPDKTAPGSAGANPYEGLKIYEQPAPPDDQVSDEETATPPPSGVPLRPQQSDHGASKVAQESGPATAPPQALAPSKPAAPAAKPAPAKAPPAAALTAAPPAPAVHAAAGSMMLQIGSFKSVDEANAAWKNFEAKHPIVGGYSPDVKEADLGDKGTWYRLRIGPFVDKTAAGDFCEKLKADGGSCIPAAP
ncbi:MAG TPA: SPOR domain-containing protein [Rhizomicrobium sp.]|nr:SPOR domain-containing protein [Rhizomicrobium sp.]